MGKNHRHKKNVKADKAKVKLKQTKTKFLPKGQNVTNTSFKVKPIILPEQLKAKDSDVPLSKRKLDVKDLLSRIKHYNENIRHDACEELSELMKMYAKEIVSQYLAQVVIHMSTLMQDKERKVRKAAVKAVNIILEKTPDDKIQPFYHCFLTNLRCAMTNIDRNVQEDSLIFLDCFLKQNSKFIANYTEKLLPELFSLFSKLQNTSSLERKLTLNLGSKMTSMSWRIRVLSRLHKVLELCLETDFDDSNKDTEINLQTATNVNIIPIYKFAFTRALTSDSGLFGPHTCIVNVSSRFNEQIVSLVPLLYETFIEVVPERKAGKFTEESVVLNEEGSAALTLVVDTLHLLWRYSQKTNANINLDNVFLSHEAKTFLGHLLSNFPYARGGSSMKRKLRNELNLDVSTDTKCTKENVLICYIYVSLNIKFNQKNVKSEMQTIAAYINELLLTTKDLNQNASQYLMEFLKLVVGNAPLLKKFGIDVRSIVDNAITFYMHSMTNNIVKKGLFNILLQLSDSPMLNKSVQYDNWLMSLPNLLCKSKLSDVTVDSLLRISKRGNAVFCQAVVEKFPDILENLKSLTIQVTKPSVLNTEDIVRKKVVYILFFYHETVPQHILDNILEFCEANPNSAYSHHFHEMLSLRSDLRSPCSY